MNGSLAASPNSFFANFMVQARVIRALILRELHIRYGRDNIGYLWLFGEPMLLASVIGLMHYAQHSGQSAGDVKPVQFGVLGYTTFILFRGVVNRSAGTIDGITSILYHRQVTILDILISRALVEFVGVFSTSFILMTLLILTGLGDMPQNSLLAAAAWVLMLWYSFGHSLIFAAITYENRTAERLVHPYSYFMVFLSGAFVPTGSLPSPLREILSYVPMTSIFELARYAWFRGTTLNYFFPLYLLSSCMLMTWVGLVLCRRVRHHVQIS